MYFKINGSGLNTSLVKAEVFKPGVLYVTQTQNEAGSISYKFKNQQGQVILTRQMDFNEAYDTYYVYDDFGNLSYVIPPILADKILKENKSTTDNSLEIRQYAYIYKYDERNRCVKKRLPGCEWIYYVYDKADRLIFTQNGEQRKNSEWLYSVPDEFGRIVQTGICHNTNISNNNYKDKLVVGTYEGNSGYSFSNFSPEDARVLTINYYDNYDFLLDMKQERRTMLEYEERQGYGKQYNIDSYSAKGLLTGTYVNTAIPSYENEFDEYSALYYDNHGRIVQTKKCRFYELGFDNEYIAYNFQGQPVKKLHEYSFITSDQTNEIYSYNYDHAGRLIETRHKLNGGSEIVIAQNTYNELGQLISTQVNNQGALNTNYSYNIRSWKTDISNSIYKEQLKYDKIGNITSISDYNTSRSKSNKWDASIRYDALSRITEYANKGGESGAPDTRFMYDKHGNIKTLLRKSPTEIYDMLSITYLGNQIQTVIDNNSYESNKYNSYDFRDMAGVGKLQSYEYDLNGAVTKDPYKCVTIENNYFNLPQRIVVDNPLVSGSIEYQYLATGEKLLSLSSVSLRHSFNPSEIAGGASMDTSTDRSELTFYCGNIIYKLMLSDGTMLLDRILIDNGYIKDGNYYFYIKDHIGNNRATTNSTGQVKAMDDYFPFGMPIKDSKWEETPQRYRFGGKEFETLMRLNLYDSHARFYDPALDRFMSVDPLCEKYYSISPYAYCLNNPLGHIDPTGLEPESSDDDNLFERIHHFFKDLFMLKIDTSSEEAKNATIQQYNQQIATISNLNEGVEAINSVISTVNPIGSTVYTVVKASNGQEVSISDVAFSAMEIIPVVGGVGKGTKVVKAANVVLETGDLLRIENAATRIGKPINVVGSRASGTAGAMSDWDYVIEGLNSRSWSKIKNSLPGAKSTIDNTLRNIDLIRTPLDKTKPYITVYPKK